MTTYYGLPLVPIPAREHGRAGRYQEASMETPPLGKGAHEEPTTGRMAWRVVSGRRCRARAGGQHGAGSCGRPAVAELNRGRMDWGTWQRSDSWWAYCADDLLAFNRAVIDGAVWWLGVDEKGHSVAGYWRDRQVPEEG